MNYTPEQHQAIYTRDRSLIVVAGAGSGKTRVLVERYLALLDTYLDWTLNALVAITFTQKAAQEMRDRVRQALQERLRAATTHDEQARWSNLLATMDSARIDTIHALCGSILRANAAEAGIDPRFMIIEPVEADALLQDVIDRVLTRLLEDDDPAGELFAHYKMGQVRDVLTAFASVPLPPTPDDPAAIMEQWHHQWRQNTAHILQAAAHDPLLQDALTWAEKTPFPDGDKLAALWHDVYAVLQSIQHGSLDECLNGLHFIDGEVKLTVGSAKAWGGKDELNAAKAPLRELRDWAREVLKVIGEPPGEIDKRAAQLLPLWLRLMRRVQDGYTALKAADDLMDFSDLETRTADLLQSRPDVAARYLGSEFRHVLVDEFQDTNERQWAIIQALTAPQQPDPDAPARLFVVGDPKQSIYGFRGADVAVFERVRGVLHDVGGADAEIPLVRSFRTHAPLIGAFNHIFGQLLQREASSLIGAYEVNYGEAMTAHRPDAPDAAPPIEIMLLDKTMSDDTLNAEQMRTWEAVELAARLKQIVTEEKRTVHDKDSGETRPIGYSDIALLFQTTSNLHLYEEALREQNISYITVAGRGYYNRQEVWDLIALLESLYNPYDDLALATALRSPLFTLSDEALFALCLPDISGEIPRLWEALAHAAEGNRPHLPAAEHERVTFAHRILNDLHTLAGRVTISELLRRAVAETGYLATLAGLPDGARRRANVEKLLKKAATSGYITLSAFTQYLNDMSDREVREGEAETDVENAVTLMTVHASKGLEFPLVVLPDASWTISNRGGSLLVSDPTLGAVCAAPDENSKSEKPYLYTYINRWNHMKGIAERKRLLYVAATRAQDVVLVSGQATWDDKKNHWNTKGWLGWLLESLDLLQVGDADAVVDYAWGQVRLWCPQQPQDMTTRTRNTDAPLPLWERNTVKSGKPLPGDPEPPPLARPVPVQRTAFARNLNATQIADLGSADYNHVYSDRFRHSIMHDTPARVSSNIVKQDDKPGVKPNIMGEIVHEALRWWRFPDADNDMTAELTSYAWKHGVVQPENLRYAVNTARGWLRDIQHTRLYRWMKDASRVYRELPFVYQTEKRVIHGIIDVLFQRPDGKWVIVDYKSSRVPGYIERVDDAAERENRRLLKQHAERYHLQVGVYAAAVERYLSALGAPIAQDQLLIYIHYLRYVESVPVQYHQWTEAIGELENKIGQLIKD